MSAAFANEAEFETFVRDVIETQLTRQYPDIYALKSKKAVDILICRDGPDPKLFFIEVKFHCARHGRLGFGGALGSGFQPELLMRRPTYFERNLRWVLASELHEIDRVLFLDSNDIREYVAGNVIGSKFNNFQNRIWREATWFTHGQFAEELKRWVLQ